MKLDHIIHPTDFSEISNNALKYASELARACHSKIHLVHVFEKPYYSYASQGGINIAVDPDHMAQIRTQIVSAAEELREMDMTKGIDMSIKLIADIPVWEFPKELNPEHSDLIVMGTQGATGLLHGTLIGTNTERVIRNSTVPVLSVPNEAIYQPIKKILFASDFADKVETIIPSVQDFASKIGAELIFGLVSTPDNFVKTKFARSRFKEISKDLNINSKLIIENSDTVTEGLKEIIFDEKVDMLSMITHGRSGLAHLMKGSLVEDISATFYTPILSFHLAD